MESIDRPQNIIFIHRSKTSHRSISANKRLGCSTQVRGLGEVRVFLMEGMNSVEKQASVIAIILLGFHCQWCHGIPFKAEDKIASSFIPFLCSGVNTFRHLEIPVQSVWGCHGKRFTLNGACSKQELCRKSRLHWTQPCHLDQYYSEDSMVLEAPGVGKILVWILWQAPVKALGFGARPWHLQRRVTLC